VPTRLDLDRLDQHEATMRISASPQRLGVDNMVVPAHKIKYTNMNTIPYLTLYRCGGSSTELVPRLQECAETTRLLICWDLQDSS